MLLVGVDIGTYSIKIADVEATSKAYAIRRVVELPLSLDLTKDRKIQIIDALRNLFAQYDLEKTQFVFSLPQKMVSSRLMHLPFKERFKVQKAIVPMLEDELPMSIEDSVFEAKLVRLAGKGADVLAMAAPRERVLDVLNLAHDCGVEPLLISADGLAFNNLFERWYEPPVEGIERSQDVPAPKNAELILNIGHTGSQLLVISDGTLTGVRNIDWGGKNIADAIGQKYGLNYIQAMRELQTKGAVILDKTSASKEQAAFSQIIETSLMALIADLRLKLLELQSELNLAWSKGHVSGGVSELKNLNGFLTQHLQVAFNRYKQFEHHPAVNFDFTPHLESVTGVAVGLALEGIRRPRNPASNFLKGDLAKQAHFVEAVWEKWGYAARLMSAAFMIFLVYAMIRESLSLTLLDQSEKVLKTQAQAVAGIQPRQASASRIRKFINAQEQIEKARRQAEKVLKMNSALDVMELISSSLPAKSQAKLEVKRLSVNNDLAEVHGYVGSESERDLVNRALQRAAVGGVSPIGGKITPPAGRVPFAFRFRVARQVGG